MFRAAGSRLLAAGAVGAYWALYELEAQRAIEFLPAPVREFFHTDTSVALGFAALFVLGIYVGKLWVLAVVLSPVVPLFFLQVRGYRAPYSEAEPPLDDWTGYLVILGTPIALGLLIRGLWNLARNWRREHATPAA